MPRLKRDFPKIGPKWTVEKWSLVDDIGGQTDDRIQEMPARIYLIPTAEYLRRNAV